MSHTMQMFQHLAFRLKNSQNWQNLNVRSTLLKYRHQKLHLKNWTIQKIHQLWTENKICMTLIFEVEQNIIEFRKNPPKLPVLSRPVTLNLDEILKRHKIFLQAYHGRSFTGNHCHKYLAEKVYGDLILSDSVVRKAQELTDNLEVHRAADDLSTKFRTLNSLFSTVHCQLSHAKPIHPDCLTGI